MPESSAEVAKLPDCSIALKCASEPVTVIERCLDSIDDDVSVHVVVAGSSDETIDMLRDKKVRGQEVSFSTTEYGNIAKSTELSVAAAEHDQVIVMDADVWFLPGSIRLLREALQGFTLAKGHVEFLGNTAMSRMIAKRRHPFNSRPDFATNPGLAMRREEVRESCDGYIFNPDVRWTEDADLNYRVQKAGLEMAYVPDAVIQHEPITLGHELRAAFLYGIGKRLSVENTPDREPTEDFPDCIIDMAKDVMPGKMLSKIRGQGLSVAALDVVWQAIYLAGYHAQKRTSNWTVNA